MVASHDGHDTVVNELLQANADVNLCDKVCFSYVNTVYESILAALYSNLLWKTNCYASPDPESYVVVIQKEMTSPNDNLYASF